MEGGLAGWEGRKELGWNGAEQLLGDLLEDCSLKGRW